MIKDYKNPWLTLLDYNFPVLRFTFSCKYQGKASKKTRVFNDQADRKGTVVLNGESGGCFPKPGPKGKLMVLVHLDDHR